MRHNELRRFLLEANRAKLSPMEKDLYLYYASRAGTGTWDCPDSQVAEEIDRGRSSVCEGRNALKQRKWIGEKRPFQIEVLCDFSQSEMRLKPVGNATENASDDGALKDDTDVTFLSRKSDSIIGSTSRDSDSTVGNATEPVGPATEPVGNATAYKEKRKEEKEEKERREDIAAAAAKDSLALAQESFFLFLKRHHADRLGRVTDHAAQGKAINDLLKDFAPEDCVACYDDQVKQLKPVGWRDTVSWLTVNKEIAEWILANRPHRNGNGNRSVGKYDPDMPEPACPDCGKVECVGLCS